MLVYARKYRVTANEELECAPLQQEIQKKKVVQSYRKDYRLTRSTVQSVTNNIE